jgi:hypothetical protein
MLFQKLLGANKSSIQYVGGYVQGFAGTFNDVTISLTSLTGGLATQPAVGDFVIIYFGTASTLNRNLVVSGYTEVVELYSNDTYDTNFVIARKFMGATPDTSVTLTGGTLAVADAGTVAVQVWRNVNVASPFDVAGQSRIDEEATATFPSITPVTTGAVILASAACAHDNGTELYLNSELTNFITTGQSDTNDSTIGAGYYYWISGSFGPQDMVFGGADSSNFSNASYVIALRPAT